MNIFLIADACEGLGPIVSVIKGLFNIIKIFVPILLLIFGVIDLAKAVIASDEKEIKEAQGRLIKRFIYAALVFFVVTFVSVLMNMVAQGGSKDADTVSWENCWRAAG